jgi:hypothetical protein
MPGVLERHRRRLSEFLVMDYLKASKKITPETQAKAEGFISLGYQRLVTFEVQGGGFSWFGQAPANKILTAYGLMEFPDMSRVHEVDQRLIDRTQNWLASQQQPDGSFKPDTIYQRRRQISTTRMSPAAAYLDGRLPRTVTKAKRSRKRSSTWPHVTTRRMSIRSR